MTNAEKYLKDNVSVEEFAHKIADMLVENKGLANSYANDIVYFLKREITPTLTEDERVILRNMLPEKTKEVTEFKIKRDIDSNLWLFTKGTLTNVTYQGNEVHGVTNTAIIFYNHLFQFIKERRRIFY